MTVAIDKLLTRCRIPQGRQVPHGLFDRVTRDRLAEEFSRQATPILSRYKNVVRIRRLNVTLRLTGNKLDESTLTMTWAVAFAQSLRETLSLSDAAAAGRIIQAANHAELRAAFLRDRLNGRAERWDYTEFKNLARVSLTDAALSLLLHHPPDTVEILTALDDGEDLDRLLVQFDEPSLKKLFETIACGINANSDTRPTLADLLWCAENVPADPGLTGFPLDSHHQALSLFLRAEGGQTRSLRVIHHTLLVLSCLLECPQILDPDEKQPPISIEDVERCTGRKLPMDLSGLIFDLRGALLADWDGAQMSPGKIMGRLIDSLDRLRPLVPTAAPVTPAKIPWLEVDSASLLLLAHSVIRLGWTDLGNDALLRSPGGARFFQALLAGAGSSVLGRGLFDKQPLHPAAALLAGIEEEPDMTGLRQALDLINIPGCRRMLNRLLSEPGNDNGAMDWTRTFDLLAGKLVREFASLLRGFREASVPSVVRQFFRTPGRVRLNHQVITVLLSPNPCNVALHISGLDVSLPEVNWMKNRRLEFHLQGL